LKRLKSSSQTAEFLGIHRFTQIPQIFKKIFYKSFDLSFPFIVTARPTSRGLSVIGLYISHQGWGAKVCTHLYVPPSRDPSLATHTQIAYKKFFPIYGSKETQEAQDDSLFL
jgi:hypothetical protein